MLSLRQKLLLGLGGYLAVLTGLSAMGALGGFAGLERMAMLMLFGLFVVSAAVFAVLLTRSVLRPIRKLTASVRQIEEGNFDLAVPVSSDDELGELAEAINAMAARLREFRASEQARLTRTQRTTQLAIDSLPHAVAVINTAGQVDLVNQTAQRLFGLRPGAAVGSIQPRSLADWLQEALADPEGIEPRGYESAVQIFDNSRERFFIPHVIPIRGDGEELVGFTLVLADTTELRRIDEAKSNLLATVSHELKTPLTSVQMAIGLVLDDPRLGSLSARQLELLDAARGDADRLRRIIENILDMARLQGGQPRLQLQAMAPGEVLGRVLEPVREGFRVRQIELATDVPAELPQVLVDPTRIDHVLANLLSNAMKYTPVGGRVVVSVKSEGAMVRFSVCDTGPGIPEAYLPRVFDKFVRVPGLAEPTGVGLGLAIAREVVEAHGGRIEVSSVVGEGSTFSFTVQRADMPLEG